MRIALGIVLGLLLLLSLPVACAKQAVPSSPSTQSPEPTPLQPPSSLIIEMRYGGGTMSANTANLTISSNGSIVYITEEGSRLRKTGDYMVRTTRTGQLSKDELGQLQEMFNACPFDAEGKCDARTNLLDTAGDSNVLWDKTRIITANYNPLLVDVTKLTDIPQSVRELYLELRSIVDNRTTEVAREKIY